MQPRQLNVEQKALITEIIEGIEKKGEISVPLAKKLHDNSYGNQENKNTVRDFVVQYFFPQLSNEELFKLTKALMEAELSSGSKDSVSLLRDSYSLGREGYREFAKRINYEPADEKQPGVMVELNKIVYQNMQIREFSDPAQAAAKGIFFFLKNNDAIADTNSMYLKESLKEKPIVHFDETKESKVSRLQVIQSNLSKTVAIKAEIKADYTTRIKSMFASMEGKESTIIVNANDKDKKSGVSVTISRVGLSYKGILTIAGKKITTLSSQTTEDKKMELGKLALDLKQVDIAWSGKNASARVAALYSLATSPYLNESIGKKDEYAKELSMFIVQAALQELKTISKTTENLQYNNAILNVYFEGLELATKFYKEQNTAQLADLAKLLAQSANVINNPKSEAVHLKTEAVRHKPGIIDALRRLLSFISGSNYKPVFTNEQNMTLFKQPKLSERLTTLADTALQESQKMTR